MITYKGSCTAGRLIASMIRQELKRLAFHNDVDLNLEMDEGLLETLFMYKVSGSKENILKFGKEFRQSLHSINGKGS